jgi:MFS family permease
MRSTLIRAIAFFPFACSYTALLPLIARAQMHDGPAVYGGLMAVIGLGSIAGTFALNSLKYRLGPDRLAALGTIGTFLALVLFGMAHELVIAIVASFVAGFSWIVMMITTFMSAQVALPEWVRGRGLAIFLTVYFGAVTLGSAVWGKVASLGGLSTALYISAAGTILGIVLTWRWKLQTAAALDLTPSLHWRKPTFVYQVKNDLGPVLVTIEYDFDPKDRAAFLGLLREIGRARKRDGAYAWKIFDDPNMVGRLVETCLIQSLLEFEYIHARVTNADRLLEEKARKFLKAPPRVAFLVAASEL